MLLCYFSLNGVNCCAFARTLLSTPKSLGGCNADSLKTLIAYYRLIRLLCVYRTMKYVGKILLLKFRVIAEKSVKNIVLSRTMRYFDFHKRHVQFLTSVPNFIVVSLTRPSRFLVQKQIVPDTALVRTFTISLFYCNSMLLQLHTSFFTIGPFVTTVFYLKRLHSLYLT